MRTPFRFLLVLLLLILAVGCGAGEPTPQQVAVQPLLTAAVSSPTPGPATATPSLTIPTAVTPSAQPTTPLQPSPQATRTPRPPTPTRQTLSANATMTALALATTPPTPTQDLGVSPYPQPGVTTGATRTGTPPTRTPAPTLTRAATQSIGAGGPTATRTRTPQATSAPGSASGKLSNIGPYLLSHPEAGQQTHNLLRNSAMRAYMAINPEHWNDADQLPKMEGYGRNWIPADEELEFINGGAAGAQAYFEKFKGTYAATKTEIHAWMSTWAFEFGNRDFANRWVAFQLEWLRLMHANGYKAGVGGMKTYQIKPGEILWLAPAIAQSDYLFLSESGAPTMMNSRVDSVFLYRDLYAELEGNLGAGKVPPIILDIAVDGKVLKDMNASGGPHWQRGYIQYGTSKTSYEADIRAYDRETLKDAYIKHVFWFATNITDDTHSFDVDTNMLAVADGWHRTP